MSAYHISRSSQLIGVFTQEEVLVKLHRGELLPSDRCWLEGMVDWEPLAVMFPPSNATPPPLVAPVDRVLAMVLPINRSGWAIAAGYLSLVSVLCLPAPFALFCGLMALRELKRYPHLQGAGRAWFGIVLGGLGTLLCLSILPGVILKALK